VLSYKDLKETGYSLLVLAKTASPGDSEDAITAQGGNSTATA
jgi:hypothetical protein